MKKSVSSPGDLQQLDSTEPWYDTSSDLLPPDTHVRGYSYNDDGQGQGQGIEFRATGSLARRKRQKSTSEHIVDVALIVIGIFIKNCGS